MTVCVVAAVMFVVRHETLDSTPTSREVPMSVVYATAALPTICSLVLRTTPEDAPPKLSLYWPVPLAVKTGTRASASASSEACAAVTSWSAARRVGLCRAARSSARSGVSVSAEAVLAEAASASAQSHGIAFVRRIDRSIERKVGARTSRGVGFV